MKLKAKITLLVTITLSICSKSMAQKRILTDTSYKDWTSLRYGQINSTGKFICYDITNMPLSKNTLVVVATDSTYERRFVSFSGPVFSEDGNYLYAKKADTLMRLQLGKNKLTIIPNCKSYELIHTETSDYFIYQLYDKDQPLTIENLKTGKRNTLLRVTSYRINKAGLALITKSSQESTDKETLNWVDLLTGTIKSIYKGRPTSNFIFDPLGEKMAFITNENSEKQIWYFDKNFFNAQMIANDHSEGIAVDHQIAVSGIWKFGADGENLFFAQELKQQNNSKNDDVKVWNSRDEILLSEYEGSASRSKRNIMNEINLSVLNINQKRIKQLLTGTQKIISSSVEFYPNIVIVKSEFGAPDESSWNNSAKLSYYLCFTKTGELRLIKDKCKFAINQITLSPDQKYLLYFDTEQKSYISYNVETRAVENLSKEMKEKFYPYSSIDRTQIIAEDCPDAIPDFHWITGTHSIIVHGTYDLWQLDLENKISPINLTEGKGNKEKIIFSIVAPQFGNLTSSNTYSITGQDVTTQAFGLYKLTLYKKDFHQILSAQRGFEMSYSNTSNIFQKAAKADGYLITLGTANVSENYFYTIDLKKLKPLTSNYPERKYNWFKAELVKYKDNNGLPSEGILYKPENFDPGKKYPVIFYYYLEMTPQFNRYMGPGPSNIGVNIPLLVSNGYIVCTPNIYRMRGKPGEASLTSVLAAANYLAKLKWIDTAKMGISGHSLGGFETNYILTHSNRFKAAFVAAGSASMVNNYNETFYDLGASTQYYVKTAAFVMGGGLDELPGAYIENSPIFDAQKLRTPTLFMHNNEDINVPVAETERFFIQLRSLQKTVWWVQYKGEDHTVRKVRNQIDLQDKVLSFFDTYLKDKPMPKWMGNHIQAPATN